MKEKSKKPKAATKASKSNPQFKLKAWYLRTNIWQKVGIWLAAILIFIVSLQFGVGQWYIWSNRDKPTVIGATFTSDYAKYFNLDPKETMTAMIEELNIRHFRLVSYWDLGEPTPGNYDFSELDWQFKLAEESGSKVSLAIGLRQPRWPECHMPKWAESMPMTQWEPELTKYMQLTMDRYKDSPALESYQLENEFFLDVFGICPDFSRDRLIREFEFAKKQDPNHPVIISRSNNAIGLPLGDPRPDMFAISIYKRVWDKTLTFRYIEYPFPDWFYGSLAGMGKILTGKDMMVHELQTEAWLPDKPEFSMNDVNDIPEQNKSLNARRLKDRIQYGEGSGMKRLDMWGVEWWYWQKANGHPELWETAKKEFQRIESQNEKLSPY